MPFILWFVVVGAFGVVSGGGVLEGLFCVGGPFLVAAWAYFGGAVDSGVSRSLWCPAVPGLVGGPLGGPPGGARGRVEQWSGHLKPDTFTYVVEY